MADSPHGWTQSPLGAVVQNIIDRRGRSIRRGDLAYGDGNGVPVLTSSEIRAGKLIVSSKTLRVTDEVYQRWMAGERCRKGDIIVTTGSPPGRVAMVPDDRLYMLGQRVVLLRADPTAVSSDFLVQQLLAAPFQRRLSAHVAGTASQGITRPRLLALPVLQPPLAEQQKIATALAAVDGAIEAGQEVVKQTRRVRGGLLAELLAVGAAASHTRSSVEIRGDLPVGWQMARLGEFLEPGGIRNGLRRAMACDDGVPVVRADSVADGASIDVSGLRRIAATDSDIDKFGLVEEDVLVVRVSSLRFLGDVGVVGESNETLVHDSNLIRIRLSSESDLCPRYLALALAGPAARHHLRSRAKPGVAQCSIDHRDLLDLRIPVPPSDEQAHLVDTIEAMDTTLRRELDGLSQLVHTKSVLVTALMTGRVRVAKIP